MKGYEIRFNIYAENEAEVEETRKVLVDFIRCHAEHGRAVTARKITEAVKGWDKNPFIRNKIVNYFK